jgi:hypothetical protein
MRSRLLVRGLVGVLGSGCIAVCGCINPFNTRLPTVNTPPAPVEKRSYSIHDPFPDEDLGPDTMTRPRGFNEPRAEPRKILESRALLGLDRVPAPPNSFNYPDTVRQ